MVLTKNENGTKVFKINPEYLLSFEKTKMLNTKKLKSLSNV